MATETKGELKEIPEIEVLPAKRGRPKGRTSLKGRQAHKAIRNAARRVNDKRKRKGDDRLVPEKFCVLSEMAEVAMEEEDPVRKFAMFDKILPYVARKQAALDPDKELEREKEEAAKDSGIGTIIQAIRQAEADKRELIGQDQTTTNHNQPQPLNDSGDEV